MRALLITFSLTLSAIAALAQDHYAVGKMAPGPLVTYSVSSSGEITEIDSADEWSVGTEVLVDSGGRHVVIFGDALGILLYRIEGNRTLTLSSQVSGEENTGFWNHLGMSQDGRIVLALFVDLNVIPRHNEFQALLVNNRLQLVPTGHVLDADGFGGIGEWTITDFHPYQALVRADQLVNLSISASGEISGPIQWHDPPYLMGGSRDWSSDGRWNLRSNQSNETDFVINETLSDGTITGHDTASFSSISSIWDCMLWPNLRGLVVGASPALSTVRLNQDMTFGSVLDSEILGFGNVGCVAVSPNSDLVIACDQAPGFDFPLFSYFLDPDTGELTFTGHTLSRPDHHADLRFVPPPTLPTLLGDANLDGVVNAADIVFLINEALPDDQPILLPQNFANADLDGDIDIDPDDLDLLIARLLGI